MRFFGLGRLTNSILGLVGLQLIGKPKQGPVWSHEQSPEILHCNVRPNATYSPWLSDKQFMAAYEQINTFSYVDIYRCYELWDLARHSANVDGAILEVGVWRGGTGCLMALAAPQKTVYLADTFEGVVKVGDKDTRYVGGEHADTSEELVRSLLTRLGATNARTLKGIFPDQTAHAVQGPVSLLHVDVDVYQSARDVVTWTLPRIPVGGVIVFDDYGFSGCEGVTRVVHELREQLPDFAFVHNLNGHAIFVRLSVPRPAAAPRVPAESHAGA